jgi:chromosome segregation ATPase
MTYRNSPIYEAASLALGALAEVGKHFDLIDTLADRRAAAEKLDAVFAKQVDEARNALAPAKAELEKVSAKLKTQRRVLDDLRARSDADLDAKIAKAQGELVELQGSIAKRIAELKNIDASFGGLHHRLNLR